MTNEERRRRRDRLSEAERVLKDADIPRAELELMGDADLSELLEHRGLFLEERDVECALLRASIKRWPRHRTLRSRQ